MNRMDRIKAYREILYIHVEILLLIF